MIDHGPAAFDPDDDYPASCIRAAQAVVADRAAGVHALGVVIGGSGNGEQIAANKVRGVRAALGWNIETARLARDHNEANVLVIGARQHHSEEALPIVEAFLATPFSAEERHARRIAQLAAFDATGRVGG